MHGILIQSQLRPFCRAKLSPHSAFLYEWDFKCSKQLVKSFYTHQNLSYKKTGNSATVKDRRLTPIGSEGILKTAHFSYLILALHSIFCPFKDCYVKTLLYASSL